MSRAFEEDVDQALMDAEYGIIRLETCMPETFSFYNRGTLVALKGAIHDYILYEFNDKFRLGISEDELCETVFQKRAEELRIGEDFIRRYNEIWSKTLGDDRVAFLLRRGGERDRAAHRHLTWTSAQVPGAFGVGSAVTRIEARDPDETNPRIGETTVIPSAPPLRGRILYRDWTEDSSDVPTLCRISLEAVRSVVRQLREEFPPS